MQKIKQTVMLLAASLSFILFAPNLVFAVDCSNPTTTKEQIQCGTCDASGADCSKATPTKDLNDTIANVINILSTLVGIVAVIMLIIGGFRYITSGGEAEKVKSAKNTILYALIGVVIVALAQVIVRFVLQKATP